MIFLLVTSLPRGDGSISTQPYKVKYTQDMSKIKDDGYSR